MTPLNHYFQDGANKQARAVMCMLQGMQIEESWSAEFHRYTAEPVVARWENCREQGYVVSLRTKGYRLHIAFFEHRNSDSICAVRWEQNTLNSPTIDTAKFGDAYKTKYDVTHSVAPHKIAEMADWIEAQLQAFWVAKNPASKDQKAEVAS